MSGQATGWVLKNGPRTDDRFADGRAYGASARAMRSVLMTIADAANADGEHAHPGIKGIVAGSLYSRSRVLQVIDLLIEEGWVSIEEAGRGRGHATVYALNLDRRKVQLSDPSSEKRSNPATEKVHFRDPSLCSPTVTTTETPASSTRSRAETIVRSWWDERAASGRPPAQSFIGIVKLVEAALKNGVAEGDLAWALRNSPTVTAAALEFALSRRAEHVGEDRWLEIMAAIAAGNRPTFDERTEQAIAKLGGWHTIKMSTRPQVERANFLRTWRAAA